MTWDPSSIAGLTWVNEEVYEQRFNQIALSGDGRLGDAAVTAAFAYDDTSWGQVPAGIFKTIATCAVNPSVQDGTIPSGKYVQLQLRFVDELGRDYGPFSAGTNYGQITAFAASMAGFGALDAADEDDGSDLASDLPWDTSLAGPPVPYLLRPTALSWPGQDGNTAIRTIWLQSEIDLVTFDFTVHSQSVGSRITYIADGWQ